MAIKKEETLGILAVIGLGTLAYLGFRKKEEIPAPVGMYSLTTRVDPTSGGSVTVEPDKDYYSLHEAIVLEAYASEGYSFSHWTNLEGVTLNSSSRIQTIVVKNEIITAHFTKEAPPILPTEGEVVSIELDMPLKTVVYQGEDLWVKIKFIHPAGPPRIFTIYAAIGNYSFWGFDEVAHASRVTNGELLHLYESFPYPTTFYTFVDIPITTRVAPGIYSAYAKMDGVMSDYYSNLIEVRGAK